MHGWRGHAARDGALSCGAWPCHPRSSPTTRPTDCRITIYKYGARPPWWQRTPVARHGRTPWERHNPSPTPLSSPLV